MKNLYFCSIYALLGSKQTDASVVTTGDNEADAYEAALRQATKAFPKYAGYSQHRAGVPKMIPDAMIELCGWTRATQEQS